jgi:hypothetical protein
MATKKEELYKRIKIAGMLSFIPLMLLAGVVGGWSLGYLLYEKLIRFYFIVPLCAGIGTIGALWETARIIRLVLRIEKKD